MTARRTVARSTFVVGPVHPVRVVIARFADATVFESSEFRRRSDSPTRTNLPGTFSFGPLLDSGPLRSYTIGAQGPDGMIVVAVTLPAATIPPGITLAETNTHVKPVRQISVDGADRQYLRVIESDNWDAFETAARADPGVESLAAIDRATTGSYYRITWQDPPPCPAVYRSDLLVERMDGTPEGWTFRLRAGDGDALRSLPGGLSGSRNILQSRSS